MNVEFEWLAGCGHSTHLNLCHAAIHILRLVSVTKAASGLVRETMPATSLSIATKGSHLGHPYGNVSICGIHIGVDRYLVATFRTTDQLLRYIPIL
ncbi:hypothetical protein H6F76_05770 [Leptolyngbya sp. FACHB-321]|uniref:hypothetical protein n=1 Tax=Leptolyngbya sp. FACHB-321 TaxID=2692807 RepID=UPI001689A712|nr:hypothetical protein [Leptolyngbya sp. FACHB-321]MBD2034541.1 hypothetical protein [Leptolyngbya sp. FACHB-321]